MYSYLAYFLALQTSNLMRELSILTHENLLVFAYVILSKILTFIKYATYLK